MFFIIYFPMSESIFIALLRFAVILAFDVRIEREAQEMADSLGVKIFAADIIYHLFDKFTAYREVSLVKTCSYKTIYHTIYIIFE